MGKESRIEELNSEYGKLPKMSKSWDLSKRFVKGEGPLNTKYMIIGQAPGRNEDIQGRPFIGAAGKYLDKLIHLAGLNRKDIYICSVVQFFPPGNRVPTKDEIALCKGFLFRQIEIIRPKLVILLGSVACDTVLGLDGVSKIHGKIIEKGGITYFVSMHPAAAVRIRTKMPIMERDFANLGKKIVKL